MWKEYKHCLIPQPVFFSSERAYKKLLWRGILKANRDRLKTSSRETILQFLIRIQFESPPARVSLIYYTPFAHLSLWLRGPNKIPQKQRRWWERARRRVSWREWVSQPSAPCLLWAHYKRPSWQTFARYIRVHAASEEVHAPRSVDATPRVSLSSAVQRTTKLRYVWLTRCSAAGNEEALDPMIF